MASTPDDPTKAQVWITKGIDEMDFEFYFPQGPKGDPGGLVKGTLIGSTTSLNDLKTDGIYHCPATSRGTTLGYPHSTRTAGVLTVHGWYQNGLDVIQTFVAAQIVGASGYDVPATTWRRTLYNGTWSSWRAQTNHRVDQTAGRAVYLFDEVNNRDQLIYGDTGWRLMAIPAINGHTTGGNVLFRRFGETVYMKLSSVQLEAGSGFATVITNANIPVGFRMISVERSMQAIGTSNNALDMQFLSCFGDVAWIRTINVSGTIITVRPTSATLSGTVSWITDEPWPTVLPGTASGSIPNT